MAPMSTMAMAPTAKGPVKVESAGPSSLLAVAVDTVVVKVDPLALVLASDASVVELLELVVPTVAMPAASEPLADALAARSRPVVLSWCCCCAVTEDASSRQQSTSTRVLLGL